MKVIVTGPSGLLGAALVPALRQSGHEVVTLVRRSPRAPNEVRWDPAAGALDVDALAGTDAAVHLAGAGIGDRRWTRQYRQLLRDSRVQGTTVLARALAGLRPAPRVLLSASATGYYGDTGEEVVDETAPPGDGFLPEICVAWEAATSPAAEAGIRVCRLRSGIVLSRSGGALRRQLLPYRLGLGGPLGSGRQWMSWIEIRDEIAAMVFLLTADSIDGPVNLTAPAPVRQRDFAKSLGWALSRPAVLPAPRFGLRLLLGGIADDLLASQRVVPHRLLDAGFAFGSPDLPAALAVALRR
jgi:uncharacterized protein (TIGR01777 family)